ncbi:MAG TPA: MFS transporter [Candidatus Dormibacteraeota bacterium]|nr:MFS transporter [Candidatus Dormibacteraeota bacterium]
MTSLRGSGAVRLGLRANLPQFSLLVGVNALVGGMVGQERTILPLMATKVFGLTAVTAALTFIVAFGLTKAISNFFAGTLSDRFGRKPVLLAGWLIGLPVPLLLIWAPTWAFVILANVLLGINQGLTWSTTVNMKIDLVGPARRGLAMGLNEAAGYGAVAVTAYLTGFIAQHAGLRPQPFFLGAAYAGAGLGLSVLLVRETRGHAHLEAATTRNALVAQAKTREVFVQTSFRQPALSAICIGGLTNNLNDGMAWGLFPLFFAAHGLSVASIGILVALYPLIWAVGQLFTGALSDWTGRKVLVVGGLGLQALSLGLIAAGQSFAIWAVGAIGLGLGTAMVYPTLLAAVGDVAHPEWRASAVGIYRLWRDAGFVVGALLSGAVADIFGLGAAIWAVAAVTAAGAAVVTARMYETHPRSATADAVPRRARSIAGGPTAK